MLSGVTAHATAAAGSSGPLGKLGQSSVICSNLCVVVRGNGSYLGCLCSCGSFCPVVLLKAHGVCCFRQTILLNPAEHLPR